MATTITLSWPPNASSEGIIKYQVFESKDGAPFVFKADVATGLNAPSLQILNPSAGHYQWKAYAVNFVGNGPFGPVAEGPDLPTAPGPITVVVVNS